MKTIILLLFVALTLFGCKEQPKAPSVLKQSILLFKDKDGVYRYDYKSKKEQCLYRAKPDETFLDKAYERNDTLTFGIRSTLSKSGEGVMYIPYYYSVALKTGQCWLSGRKVYDVAFTKIHLKTETISPDGKTTVTDSVMPYLGSVYSYKNVVFNDPKPRFFSQHVQGTQTVFSEAGNIYYVKNGDTTLLARYNGRFDSKFGNGYYQPQLDPTGKFAIFRHLPGLMKKEMPSLQQADLKTKSITVVKKGQFVNPQFSKDGNFILFSRDQKQGKSATWISDIYVLDLNTMEERKISGAYEARWLQ